MNIFFHRGESPGQPTSLPAVPLDPRRRCPPSHLLHIWPSLCPRLPLPSPSSNVKVTSWGAGQQQTQFPLPTCMCWVSWAEPLPGVPSSQHASGQRPSGQRPPHPHPHFQDFLLPGRKREKDFPVPPPNLTTKGILLLGGLNCWDLPGPSTCDRRGSWGCV